MVTVASLVSNDYSDHRDFRKTLLKIPYTLLHGATCRLTQSTLPRFDLTQIFDLNLMWVGSKNPTLLWDEGIATLTYPIEGSAWVQGRFCGLLVQLYPLCSEWNLFIMHR